MNNKNQTSTANKSAKHAKRVKTLSLGDVLYKMSVLGWLCMCELYLWITRWHTIIEWIQELKFLWIGGLLGIVGTLLILINYHKLKKVQKFQHPKRKLTFNVLVNRLKFVFKRSKKWFPVCLGIFRVMEMSLIVTHFREFLSWWPGGFLMYASVGWLLAIIVVTWSFKLYNQTCKQENNYNYDEIRRN